MTTAIPALEAPEAPAATQRRSFAPSPFAEFMLVGGATFVLFPLAWLLRKHMGLGAADYAFGFVTFYGAYVINDPHFSVTYLLFYKDVKRRAFDRERNPLQRLRYLNAGFVVPATLTVWTIVAMSLHSAQMIGWMVQLMLLLVGWHYVKQGFGVLMVLFARRGAHVSHRERAVILIHCFTAWAYAWANPAVPAGEFEEKGVVYWAPARPRWLELTAATALAASTVLLFAVLVTKWRRDKTQVPVVPLSVFLVTVWSWTIYTTFDPLIQYAIPALHSIQYLYFVWLMKHSEARETEGPPSFGPPAGVRVAVLFVSALGLGWFLLRGMPSLLDAAIFPRLRGVPSNALGPTPYFAAITVIVNVHHYFMDNVIWRRDNPDTRYLREAKDSKDARGSTDSKDSKEFSRSSLGAGAARVGAHVADG